MADTYFVGLRATDDLVADERPLSWRDGILKLYPNGDAPLTALTALMKSEKVSDPHFHWWTETFDAQRAAVTGVYTDAMLASAYSSGATAGATLYIKMSDDNTKMFRQGHQVLLRDASDYTVDVVAKVESAGIISSSVGYLAVTLLEADDNSTSHDLSNCDTILIIGSINPQGGARPEAISKSPSYLGNYTQIFRDSLDLARTLMETNLRNYKAYNKAKSDALERHAIQMEKAFLWGVQSLGTGANGKPEYTTAGLLSWIKTYGLVDDFSLSADSAYDGKTWLEAGVDWLESSLEQVFRFGTGERLAFCGSGALLGIQKLVRAEGVYNISVREAAYGIKVLEWVTPFGTIYLKRHPLFTYEPTNRNSMLLIDPSVMTYKYITDTTFMPDNTYMKGGGTGYDGKQEEFLTEAGLEVHHPETLAYLNGVGIDNAA